MIPFTLNFDLRSAPILFEFMQADDPIQVAIGPVGSGKTSACCVKVGMLAAMQEPAADGIRYMRAAIIRNTSVELRSTTIPSWLEVYPEEACGRFRWSAPMRHVIRVPRTDGQPGIYLEAEFFGLDKPKDVRRLLSYQATLILFNEVREIPKAIIDVATMRVGRYPSKALGKPTWYGILADSNPPDEDHWLFQAFDEPPEGWAFFHQPPGVLEMKPTAKDGVWKSVEPSIPYKAPERLIIRSAGKAWAVNPGAENLVNLPVPKGVIDGVLSPRSYYGAGLAGKNLDHIQSYLQGKFVYVQEGQPVIPEFNRDLMVSAEVEFNPELDLIAGGDISGLQPSAVFLQRHPRGIWLALAELACFNMGMAEFSRLFHQLLAEQFGGKQVKVMWGDPAGNKPDDIYEVTAFQHLRKEKINALAAPTNHTKPRVDAIRLPMGRLIDGKPGFMVHPRCKMLVKGLAGAWNYKRLQVAGTAATYSIEPTKNEYSHVCESLGYGLSGGGEHRALTRAAGEKPKPKVAKTDFSVFGG